MSSWDAFGTARLRLGRYGLAELAGAAACVAEGEGKDHVRGSRDRAEVPFGAEVRVNGVALRAEQHDPVAHGGQDDVHLLAIALGRGRPDLQVGDPPVLLGGLGAAPVSLPGERDERNERGRGGPDRDDQDGVHEGDCRSAAGAFTELWYSEA